MCWSKTPPSYEFVSTGETVRTVIPVNSSTAKLFFPVLHARLGQSANYDLPSIIKCRGYP